MRLNFSSSCFRVISMPEWSSSWFLAAEVLWLCSGRVSSDLAVAVAKRDLRLSLSASRPELVLIK